MRGRGGLAASQTRTVASSLAEAMSRPSGLTATATTSSVCPLKVRSSWPEVGVPDAYRLVGGARHDPRAVGQVGQRQHRAGVPPDHGELRPRPGIPDPEGPVEAGGGDPPAVGAEGHGANLVGVPLEDGERVVPVLGLPELDRVVIAGRGEGAAVGAERDGGDRAAVCPPKTLWIRWPSRASQTRMLCFERAATRVRPSGLQASFRTASGEPSKRRVGRPVSTA